MHDKVPVAMWGTGYSTDTLGKYAEMANIICLISKDRSKQTHWSGLPVRTPSELLTLSPDITVLSDSDFFSEAYHVLTACGLSPDRIRMTDDFFGISNPALRANVLFADCITRGYDCLLDFGCHLARENLFVTGKTLPVFGCITDPEDPLPPLFLNLYRHVWEGFDRIPDAFRSEAVYLGDCFRWSSMEEALLLIAELVPVCRAVYLNLPFPDTPEHRKWNLFHQLPQFRSDVMEADGYRLLRVCAPEKKESVQIYVVTHKEAVFPSDPLYLPLWVGDAPEPEGKYLHDNTPPEISFLNRRINECTGLYWIWKHAEADIIGLVHYRRYFVRKAGTGDLLTREDILRELETYDCILAPLQSFVLPVRVQLRTGLKEDVFAQGCRCLERLIAERHPEDLYAFHRVMDGHTFFPCHMFVMRREHFARYCTWLFSFLIDAAIELDFDTYPGNNPRIAGYFAERMLTVWLLGRQLRVKEIPVEKLSSV